MNFMEILLHGERNAVSAVYLVNRLGLKDTRDLRLAVSSARANGQIICSGKAGYYIPETREELKRFIRKMETMATSTLKALKSAREALKQIEGQLSIDDLENGSGTSLTPD